MSKLHHATVNTRAEGVICSVAKSLTYKRYMPPCKTFGWTKVYSLSRVIFTTASRLSFYGLSAGQSKRGPCKSRSIVAVDKAPPTKSQNCEGARLIKPP